MTVQEPMQAGEAARAEKGRILSRLAGLEGVQFSFGEAVIEPAAVEGATLSLAQLLAYGPLEVLSLLEIAARLARTIAAVHARGVLHLDINPTHVQLRGEDRTPSLCGFDFATTFAEQRPIFTHHREIRGDLAYLAPEQTGRTGRQVDQRADLYALGATLYEAATGHRPFEAEDALQQLRDLLVQPPAMPLRWRPDLPAPISQIILRLLEKEPERRYQSAEGVAHDLELVRNWIARGDTSPVVLCAHDFPMQLSAPSRLVGRDAEIAQLSRALEDAVRGSCRFILLTGAPGVGKSSLASELRSMVTARGGWYVAGKFDQYRYDAPPATVQAMRALGRLLMAEPEAQLVAERERILRALGSNAALVCGLPEFSLLLGPQIEPPEMEPALAEDRLLATGVDLLRTIASSERPLVMVLDDLQWAPPVSLRLVDALMVAKGLRGLVLVGSYRDTEVDAVHPMGAALSRWERLVPRPLDLRLANLPQRDVQEMLREMLRLPRSRYVALANLVFEQTGGNPFDTVELLNSLRRDGALRPGPHGWDWDAAALRRYVGHSGVLDLLSARVARLPRTARRMMRVIACLGGQVRRQLLCAATALSPAEVDEHLAPALDDGLLVFEPGQDGWLRMKHDRVQQAVYGSLQPARRRALHLEIARRLAATDDFNSVAVQLYLPACQDIVEPAESRYVAKLLRHGAVRAKRAVNYALTERLIAAALSLASRLPPGNAEDEALVDSLRVDHHTALCNLGRFEEADAVYGAIERRGNPVEDWVEAACAQIDSLQSRSRSREAMVLGLLLIRQFGLDVPSDFAAADIAQRLTELRKWIEGMQLGNDSRLSTADRRSTALVMVLNRVSYPAYLTDIRVLAWLILEARVLWDELGPSPGLVTALGSVGAVTLSIIGDYRTGYLVARHALQVSEKRGWEPNTSEARFLLGVHSGHWAEPLEQVVAELHKAREGLLRSGALQTGCFTYRPSTTAMLDCHPTLQGLAREVESGKTMALRLRSEYVVAMMSIETDMLRVLRGEKAPREGSTNEALQRQSSVPASRLGVHYSRALVAALFDDLPALAEHAGAAMEHVRFLASYRGAQARVLQAYALARKARAAEPADRDEPLAQFDLLRDWLAERAVDAPGNFMHLLKWLEAERAWAVGDFRGAAGGFDEALGMLESIMRPWHHAFIAERCGMFHLAQGMNRTGRQFITQAWDLYQDWGAHAKVKQLEATHAFLEPVSTPSQINATGIDASNLNTVDMLAILRASQALSSETSVTRLKARVVDLMGALTGATSVQFALWDEDHKDWVLTDVDVPGAPRIAAGAAGERGLLPLAAFRYAERTLQPLLVEDATRDDRFSRDPSLAALVHCSLLIVPILSQGSMRAMLVLENHTRRGAFTTAGLDAVLLIAGHLAVSLENAMLYDRLEQRVMAQTRELVEIARRAGMSQIAMNVLHNVGNVLNSVNVSARTLDARVLQSRSARVTDVADLLESNAGNFEGFFASEGGRMLPRYMRDLGQALAVEREEMHSELQRLVASVDHIKNVVAVQLSYAGASGMKETCNVPDLIDDALRIQGGALARRGIVLQRDYADVRPVELDKTRLMQILVNLIENANHAMDSVAGERTLRIALRRDETGLTISVTDKGCGIAPENADKIFVHGFTTKSGGHGFGLHSCAMAAKEMGCSLAFHSDGPGKGTTFTLNFPPGSDT